MLVTSTDFWEDLDDDVRSELEKIIDEVTAHVNSIAADLGEADKKRIVDSGRSEIIQLTAEEREAWKKAMAPVWGKFEDAIGKDLIDAAKASNAQS
jgi:C4-dicarboxylate-binding protein DctP